MAQNLFVYGSLLFRDIYEAVALEPGSFRDARLRDHIRLALRGELYPAILPRVGCEVEGKLVVSLSPNAMERIDRFEGGEYDRVNVEVETASGQRRAQAYVLRPDAFDRVTEASWDPAEFERLHLGTFLSRYPAT